MAPDIIRWTPGVPGRGLPYEWSWEGNSTVRALFTKQEAEDLVNNATGGDLFLFMISPERITRGEGASFVVYLECQRIRDRLEDIERQEEEDQVQWEDTMRTTGYIKTTPETRRIVLTNLSSETRTIVLRGQKRQDFKHATETFHTLRGQASEVICFCTGILRENDLSLACLEVTTGPADNKDIPHTMMKISTERHSRVHVLLLDREKTADCLKVPSLWTLCCAKLQGSNFQDTAGLRKILPPSGPSQCMPGFRGLPDKLQFMNLALSNLNSCNGRILVPRPREDPYMNLGPLMMKIMGQYEPHLCCRHEIYPKICIDESLENPQRTLYCEDVVLRHWRTAYGIQTRTLISPVGREPDEFITDETDFYQSQPGNVIITIQNPRTR